MDIQREGFENQEYVSNALKMQIIRWEEKFGVYIPCKISPQAHQIAREICFGWKMWQAAKADAVPEGFVLMPREIDNFESLIAKALEKGIVRGWGTSEIYAAIIEAQEQDHG